MSLLYNFIFPQDKKLFKYLFFLAFPVILSNISRVVMGLTDTIMLKDFGSDQMGGAGYGGMIAWGAICLGIALRTGTQTLVARRLGQKKYDRCSIAFWNMQLFAFIIGIPITFLCFTYTNEINAFFLNLLQTDLVSNSDTFKASITYGSITFLGTYFMYINFVFQGFYTGIEKTKVHMKATIFSCLINLYLNIGFIYGTTFISNPENNIILSKLSFLWPSFIFQSAMLGVKGAAIGTLVATICMAIHYAIYLFDKTIITKYQIFKIRIHLAMLKKQIKLSFPVGIQEFLSMTSLIVFYSILFKIGTIQNPAGPNYIMAATHVIFRIMHAAFMPAIGVGQACATLVGKFLGEKKPDKAESAIKESLRGSAYMMGIVGVIFVCFAQYIVPFFTNESQAAEIAIKGLRFVGCLQLIDAVCFTLWFALTGAGDTKKPAIVDIISHWVFFVPVSYFLGIYLDWGFWGPWIAFGMHLTFFSTYIFIRFRKGKWKKIIV